MAVSALALARAAAPRPAALVEGLGDTVCLTYASLVFSRSRAVGALLVAATATSPVALGAGLGAVLVALATAHALRLPPDQIRSGQLSYNALMVGLCLSALAPVTPATVALVAVAAAASVLATAALHLSVAVGYGLPILTLPFLAVFYLTVGALPAGLTHGAPAADALGALVPWEMPRTYLRDLGAILCAPRVDAGAVVLCALALHSRIAAALSLAGFALAWSVAPLFLGAHADPSLAATVGLNGMLVAVALGGVWFIPSPWSYALALGGVIVCVVTSLGVAARFDRVGLPLLIAPFNATVALVLYVMRQRVSDGRPHAVDFAPGTPEQNLTYFRSRAERFGSVMGVRFAAPFRGRWECTQGVSGGVTHEGPWRHALDFEVFDDQGRTWRGAGTRVDDFHCYKLPVVAPAAGVVARVIDHVPDNPVGEVNLDDNWGNVVIVRHAPGLYSCVAHLAPGSVAVREGQAVQAGELLGLCGNSGRSATPHLHVQLQATPEVGAATLPIELHDAVFETVGAPVLHPAKTPAYGDVVRRLEPDEARAQMLRFEYGRVVRHRVEGGRRARDESVVADIDLVGGLVLRSRTTGATLYYEHTPAGFTVHDVTGAAGSALHLVRAALSRVPFDADDALSWSDRLPIRPFLPAWMRPLFDLASPFGAPGSLVMRYRARRRGRALVIEGASERLDRAGNPWVVTSACLAPGAGLVRLDVRVRGRARRVELDPAHRPDVTEVTTALSHGGLCS